MCTKGCRTLPTTPHGRRKFGGCAIVSLLIGFACVFIAIYIPIFLDQTLDSALRTAGIIDSKDAQIYEAWAGVGPKAEPIDLYIYLLNFTNPDAVLNGAKPVVQEVGPFVYFHHRVKFNVNWTEDRSILSYKEWSYYTFDPVRSAGPEDTNITSVNMVYIGARYFLMNLPPFGPQAFYDTYAPFTDTQRLSLTRTAYELIWGYVDPLTQQSYPGFVTNRTFEQAQEAAKTDAIYTGLNDYEQVHQMQMYQDYEFVSACPAFTCPPPIPAWASMEASRVRGSDGMGFPPPVLPSDIMPMFIPPMFRPVDLIFQQTVKFKGMNLYKFVIDNRELQNASVNPKNADWFQFGTPGLFNISTVLNGVPAYVTKPRFEDVGQPVYSSVEYVLLDNEDYDTEVFIEPRSGFALRDRVSSQVNVMLEPVSYNDSAAPLVFSWMPAVKPVVFPLFWVYEQGEIGDKDADFFASAINAVALIQGLCKGVGGLLAAFLLLFGFGAIGWLLQQRRKRKDMHEVPSDATHTGSSSIPHTNATPSAASESSHLLDGSVPAYSSDDSSTSHTAVVAPGSPAVGVSSKDVDLTYR